MCWVEAAGWSMPSIASAAALKHLKAIRINCRCCGLSNDCRNAEQEPDLEYLFDRAEHVTGVAADQAARPGRERGGENCAEQKSCRNRPDRYERQRQRPDR